MPSKYFFSYGKYLMDVFMGKIKNWVIVLMKEERESGVWREAGALQAWKSTEFHNCWAMKETCTVNPNLELPSFHQKVPTITRPPHHHIQMRIKLSIAQRRSSSYISTTQNGAWWCQNEDWLSCGTLEVGIFLEYAKGNRLSQRNHCGRYHVKSLNLEQ